MQEFPHHYSATAAAAPQGEVLLESGRLPALVSMPPPEFGGPDDRWSPETLLIAALADCFVLTFRALAAASKLSWSSLQCEVQGTLDRVDGGMRFTHFVVQATLVIPREADPEKAQKLLGRAEKTCLISNSLKAQSELSASVRTE